MGGAGRGRDGRWPTIPAAGWSWRSTETRAKRESPILTPGCDSLHRCPGPGAPHHGRNRLLGGLDAQSTFSISQTFQTEHTDPNRASR